MYKEVDEQIKVANKIVILQADNPDGDSLGSSLALEALLSEMGKTVYMVCAVDMPAHLRHLSGWDRVVKEIPSDFDLSIIVDTSSETLFEKYEKDNSFAWIKSKPVIVLDHHQETGEISYATISINEEAVATGELIYEIATANNWPLPVDACEMMVSSIMSDSLGLTTDATPAKSIRTVAELVDRGVSMAKLENNRREMMRKEKVLIPYKGELLKRVKFDDSGRIATVSIPWREIEEYSPLYNPSMLVIDDMRIVIGVNVAIAYKVYNDGKITAKIRANYGSPIAHKLAEEFGGGGHPYAAGFKILDKTDPNELEKKVNDKANYLLDEL